MDAVEGRGWGDGREGAAQAQGLYLFAGLVAKAVL